MIELRDIGFQYPMKNRHAPRGDLILAAVFLVAGYVGNSLTQYVHQEGSSVELFLWDLEKNVLTLAVYVYVAIRVLRGQATLQSLGFTLSWRAAVSLGLAAAVLVSSAGEVSRPLYYGGPMVFALVSYGLVEELVCRVLLISGLVTVFGASKKGVFAAVLISSVLFALVHLPIRSSGEVQSLVLTSMVFGYVYYLSRSILFPALLHATANAASMSGYLGGAIMLLLYLVLAIVGRAYGGGQGQTAEGNT